MRNRYFLSLTLSLLPLAFVHAQENQAPRSAPAQTTGSLTLAKAIATALGSQPQIATSTATRESQEQRLKQTKARFLPSITPTYNYQNQYTFGKQTVFLGGGIVTELPSGRTITTRQEQVALNYRLFDSGSRDLGARQASQNLRASEFAEANAKQTVIGSVSDAYYAALRNDALVRVSEAQVERANKTFEQIRFQAEVVGVTAKKDILQAEADYLNAKVNLLQAHNNADLAYSQLRSAMGIGGSGRLVLADVAKPSAETPLTAMVEGVKLDTQDAVAIAKMVELAQQNRPDLKQALAGAAASATGVKLAQINTRPLLNVDLSASYQFDAANDPTRQLGNNRAVVASITYPLFDGGASRANVHATEATLRAQEAQVEGQKLQVSVDVEQAWRNLTQARATVPATDAALAAARKNYEAASEALRLGAGSTVEVITAQTALVQAETNYVQAIYNFYTTDARLARVLGQADRIGGAE